MKEDSRQEKQQGPRELSTELFQDSALGTSGQRSGGREFVCAKDPSPHVFRKPWLLLGCRRKEEEEELGLLAHGPERVYGHQWWSVLL